MWRRVLIGLWFKFIKVSFCFTVAVFVFFVNYMKGIISSFELTKYVEPLHKNSSIKKTNKFRNPTSKLFIFLHLILGVLMPELLHLCAVAHKCSNWGVMEAQAALIAAFRSSAVSGLESLVFLLLTVHRCFYQVQVRSVCWTIAPSDTLEVTLKPRLVPLAVWTGSKSCWKIKHFAHAFLKCRERHKKALELLVDDWVDWISENSVDQCQ